MLEQLKLKIKKRQWRKLNKRNKTIFTKKKYFNNVIVGDYSYGKIEAIFTSNDFNLKIGKCCSIGPNVLFIVSSEHNYKCISTYPLDFILSNEIKSSSKGDIIIGDGVWIGANVTILSGVMIGEGAVIGAGAVVTKNVPPYTIVCGNPASVMKRRFSNDVIDKILKYDLYSKVNECFLQKNKNFLESNVDDDNIDEILRVLEEN